MEEYFGYIYKTTDIKTALIYVGKRQCSYFDKKYFGSGKRIKAIIKNCKENNIDINTRLFVEQIDYAQNLEELNTKEKFWIQKLSSTDQNIGYNFRDGGDGGDVYSLMSDEDRLQAGNKISLALTGIKRSDKTKKKMSDAKLGRVVSDETRKKLHEKNLGKEPPNKGKPMSEDQKHKLSEKEKNFVIAKNKVTNENIKISKEEFDNNRDIYDGVLIGRTLSEDIKQKISNAMKEKITNEWIENQRQTHLGKLKSEETKQKISASRKNKKRILCIETGEIFDSISAAVRKYHNRHIADVAGGKRNLACGMHWKFI